MKSWFDLLCGFKDIASKKEVDKDEPGVLLWIVIPHEQFFGGKFDGKHT